MCRTGAGKRRRKDWKYFELNLMIVSVFSPLSSKSFLCKRTAYSLGQGRVGRLTEAMNDRGKYEAIEYSPRSETIWLWPMGQIDLTEAVPHI